STEAVVKVLRPHNTCCALIQRLYDVAKAVVEGLGGHFIRCILRTDDLYGPVKWVKLILYAVGRGTRRVVLHDLDLGHVSIWVVPRLVVVLAGLARRRIDLLRSPTSIVVVV